MNKSIYILGILLLVWACISIAPALADSSLDQNLLNEKYKVLNYIDRLENNMQTANSTEHAQKITILLDKSNMRLNAIDHKLSGKNSLPIEKKDSPITDMKVFRFKLKSFPNPQYSLGANAGMYAGLMGLIVEGRVKIDKVTSIRIGAGMLSGEDPNKVSRKHTLVYVDGIYYLDNLMELWNLNPPFHVYESLGANYNISTSDDINGAATGSYGAQLSFGGEIPLYNWGLIYSELGACAIRTGFAPGNKGVSLNIGFRSAF